MQYSLFESPKLAYEPNELANDLIILFYNENEELKINL